MSSKKLLLVEDQHDARFYYRKILSNSGYEVSVAQNGREALELLKKESFPIVITDWLMPIMDGFELTRKIRKELKEQPVVIILTAVNSAEAKKGALFAGADEYIAKPVEKETLIRVIETVRKKTSVPPSFAKLPNISIPHKNNFYCVGVVASTGGPSTLSTFFGNLGTIKNAAFMVVQHGPEWMLKTFTDALKKKCDMPVQLGRDGMVIQPGQIYVAPGRKHMVLTEGTRTIELLNTKPVNYVIPSADPLFKSISKSFGNKSIGMVFTGMGYDGSLGAGYISATGGKVIVQHTEDAILPAMPKSVIRLKLATKVSPLSTIHRTLQSYLY